MFFTEALSLFSQNAGSACRTGQLSINRFQSFWNHVPQCPGGSCQIRAKGAPPADARRTASSHKAPLNGSCPVWTVGTSRPPGRGIIPPPPPNARAAFCVRPASGGLGDINIIHTYAIALRPFPDGLDFLLRLRLDFHFPRFFWRSECIVDGQTTRRRVWLTAGAAGLWLGMPNALIQIPVAALLYPAALFFAGSAAARRGGPAQAFRQGWLCGLAGASACLYWVAIPIHEVGGLPWLLAAPCALALGAYIGLYGGAFAALVCLIRRRADAGPNASGPAASSAPPPVSWSVSGPVERALLFGLIWHLLEWVRGWFCTGFPWLSLASAFAPWPALIQGASLVGSYGLSGIMAGLVCLALEDAALSETDPGTTGQTAPPRAGTPASMTQGRERPKLRARPAVLAATGFAMLLAFGMWRLPPPEQATGAAGTANRGGEQATNGNTPALPLFTLIQGNIDQNVKWDPAMQRDTVRRYLDLSAEALAQTPRPDLLIWPETAMPFDYLHGKTGFPAWIRTFAAERETALLFGAPGFRRRLKQGKEGTGQEYEAFNRAFLVSREGRDVARYEKEHLVPFGEYLPPWLDAPFLRPLLQGVGNFSPGEKRLPLVLPSGRASARPSMRTPVRTGRKDVPAPAQTPRPPGGEEAAPALVLGVLICYETIFPELARQRVADGATVFVNISNDAWFGRSAAPRQHLQLGLLRAVEQRRWLARATNTGISAFIDPFGRVVAAGGLFTEQNVTHAVRPLEERTVFFYLEPVLPGLAALLALALLARHAFRPTPTHRFRKQPCSNSPI